MSKKTHCVERGEKEREWERERETEGGRERDWVLR